MDTFEHRLRAVRVTARIVAKRWFHRLEQAENGTVSRTLSADVTWMAPANALVDDAHRLTKLFIGMTLGIASAVQTRLGQHLGLLSYAPARRDEAKKRDYPAGAFLHLDLEPSVYEELWVRAYERGEVTVSCVIDGFETTNASNPHAGEYRWPVQRDGKRPGLPVVAVSITLPAARPARNQPDKSPPPASS